MQPRNIIQLATRAFVEYETFVLNPDGSVASHRKPKRNLIYDQGLNQVATNVWAECFRNVAVGTGTNPTKRDSAATTFTRAGNAVSSSANFFEATDVGRLLKWDTGEEAYIATFVDAQNVTTISSGTIAAAQGTIYYVNDTGLQNETMRTNTCTNNAGDCGTTFGVDTYTHKRTFLFPAVGAPVTLREIGWSPNAGAGANLFGRDLIPGAGDALLTGQQYKVVVRLFITISPVTQVAQSDVGNNGYNTAGNAIHEYILSAYSGVNSSGATTNPTKGLEPSSQSEMNIFSASPTLLASPSFTDQNSGGHGEKQLTNAAYTNGNFYMDSSTTYAVTEANGTHYGFFFGSDPGGNATNRCFSQKFTAPQTKDNLHTLKITLRKSWQRVLVN